MTTDKHVTKIGTTSIPLFGKTYGASCSCGWWASESQPTKAFAQRDAARHQRDAQAQR